MTLFEMVVICRAGLARNTRKLIKHISYEAEAIGANMRTANILGDRILARPLKGNDRNNYVLGNGFLWIIRMHISGMKIGIEEYIL